ncbi:MAG: TPM domain-containing protein, partial [Rhodomicrobium sp.]|nr:TPM domain-containing protein [Rhodomicrobium sp.]
TNSLQGYPIEDFGYQLGRAWGIGQKGTNNGVLLIVAPTERKVRIEVGRGLEPQLTDLLTALIIQNTILPAFRRGDFPGGIKAGVHDIKDAMLGDAEAVKQRIQRRPLAKKSPEGGMLIPLLFIVGIFVLVFWVQSQQARPPLSGGRYRRAGYGGPVFFPGGWGGGGKGGGGGDSGGFSGGGGDFGGGGSSGSW